MVQTKVNLGKFPTEIIEHRDILEGLEGRINLFFKHEENTDELGLGVKIRQLEYLFGYAVSQGFTHLIADGVLDSHCCTAIAHYSGKFGLSPVLVIKDEKPISIEGNHKTIADSGAEIFYIGKNPERNRLEQIKKEIAEKYSSKGSSPLLVPTGPQMKSRFMQA